MSEAIVAFAVVYPRGLAEVPAHMPLASADGFWALLDRLANGVWALADSVWTAGLSHTPALAIGLALVAAIPVLLLAGLGLRARRASVGQGADDRTRSWRRSAIAALDDGGIGSADGSGQDHGDAETGHATKAWRNPARPPTAMLIRIVGGDSEAGREVPLGALRVLRIGREADNDVCLSDPTVHRYHAVISRSPDDGFVISDLSGRSGNGVVVNGARVSTHPLSDGDRLTLGRAELLVVMR